MVYGKPEWILIIRCDDEEQMYTALEKWEASRPRGEKGAFVVGQCDRDICEAAFAAELLRSPPPSKRIPPEDLMMRVPFAIHNLAAVDEKFAFERLYRSQ